MRDDLQQARAYGDRFRRYLTGALTGGLGIILYVAMALGGVGVSPRWATLPVGIFVFGLVVVGIGLLMGEHRSILRHRSKNAQRGLPKYKMGITWNLLGLTVFALGAMIAVARLGQVVVP